MPSKPVSHICPVCQKEFFARKKAKYCSATCTGRAQQRPVGFTCVACGKECISTPWHMQTGTKKYCSVLCRDKGKRARLDEQFWSRFDQSRGPDACWPYLLSCDKDGYGKMKYKQKDIHSHVFAFVLIYGEVPPGHVVMHSCDNPPCGNWRHLSAGTPSQNRQDMINKGRYGTGELNGRAKITDAQVQELRELFTTPQPRGTAARLARELGICKSHVGLILKGRSR